MIELYAPLAYRVTRSSSMLGLEFGFSVRHLTPVSNCYLVLYSPAPAGTESD